MHIYDVVIVGAGPVGLATANGLRDRGIENILVLDQTRAFRRVGQGVDILPNGLKALKCLSKEAYEEVIKTAITNTKPGNSSQSSPKWFVRDLQGKQIRSIALNFDEWVKNYSEGRISVAWFDLQTALRNLIPEEQVKANHRCIDVAFDEEKKYVRVDCLCDTTTENNPYAHWESEAQNKQVQSQDISKNINQNINKNTESVEKKSFRAKLVIAADGINSTVRKVLYRDTNHQVFSRPEYSGYAAIICSEIANVPDEIQTEIRDKFLQNAPIVSITQDKNLRESDCEQPSRMMLLSRKPGQFTYIVHIPVDLNELQENYRIEVTLNELEKSNFPNAIKELVRLSKPENMQHRTYYIHRATVSDSLPFPDTANLHTDNHSTNLQPPWYKDKVVLVGDAAHGMPPFAAQGVNQGLEDALIIAELVGKIADSNQLNDENAIREAFEKYENIRRPVMEYIQKITMTGLNYSSNQQELDKYNQQIFARDLEQVVEALKS
ncbi:monooxygenase FAD-binding protein [Calothrix parasitica NIES-267]|uniref:Monooxygenase FAD-binding protein n=1 Tax=Calothrix parasitica NIES-267 TaxID=1973488 RepID=A0A1Z4LHP0_9CYAN|nr:monooxygenase FAD-binding protein [Calothrix parasitica NIES-267]